MLKVVAKNGLSLELLSNGLKNDRDVVLKAVNQNGISY